MFPRWYGLALIVSIPVSLPLAAYGSAVSGLIMVILGYTLWSRKGIATRRQSPRVR